MLSNLLIGMAPHVSRFVKRLFEVDAPAAAIARVHARSGRSLPLQGRFRTPPRAAAAERRPPCGADAEDDAIVEALILGASASDRELAIARAGCSLLDAEKANPGSRIPNPASEALKRWCAARVHDRAYRDWVIFRFPENVEPFRLVEVEHPAPQLPEALAGPEWRRRRRDGFKLTDARMKRAKRSARSTTA